MRKPNTLRNAAALALAILLSTICVSAGAEENSSFDHYQRSDTMLAATMAVGATHHVDHVLRQNHSGFPFQREVTPFTYSLAIYPLAIGGYVLDAGPNYWILFESLSFVGLGLAHTLIEPPDHQYRPWVDGSNMLGIQSPVAGRTAQAVSILLHASIGAHLISSIYDGYQCGFTWTRQPCDSADDDRAGWTLAPTGSGIMLDWRW